MRYATDAPPLTPIAPPLQTDSPGTVGVIALGCPKNVVDTEVMLGEFRRQGYRFTADPVQADILVVNTCAFVADAEAESRQAIADMAAIKRRFPNKRLVVTGCLSQRHGERLIQEIPEIDLQIGTGQYYQLIPILDRTLRHPTTQSANQVAPPDAAPLDLSPEVGAARGAGLDRMLTTRPHSAYLKIAEGCNNPCAFCIIPQLRGRYRSRLPDVLTQEARQLVRNGARELILVSQDTTLYGRDLAPRMDLASLLDRLSGIEGLAWIRLLYLYPTLITDALLDTMASHPAILPYLDIPLQHSHGDLLARMRRVERPDTIQKLLERIRLRMPHATLRSTFIVGFPGESEAAFRHLESFITAAQLDHVGVFTYSDEVGTTAHAMDNKIPPELAEERRDRLMALQQGISQKKLARLRGKILPVLVDGPSEESPALMVGRTAGQAPEVDGVVYINAGAPAMGRFARVRITDSWEYDMMGTCVSVSDGV
jgi:ribosomal protein S12 methylthiotransferase